MTFTAAVLNDYLDDLDVLVTHVSLHTADPGLTGADELAGGSYTREAITWAAASGGSKTAAAALTFQVPVSDFTHFGLWSAVSAGTFRGGGELDAPQSYTTPGTFEFTPTINATAP